MMVTAVAMVPVRVTPPEDRDPSGNRMYSAPRVTTLCSEHTKKGLTDLISLEVQFQGLGGNVISNAEVHRAGRKRVSRVYIINTLVTWTRTSVHGRA